MFEEKKITFFDRIMQIIDFYGIKSVNSFAKEYLKYDSSEKINRLKDIKKRPSFDILEDISNKFEDIDANWLLTGRGEMLRNNQNQNIHNQTHTHSNSLQNSQQIAENQCKDTKNISNTQKKLIPLYNNISSIGGTNEQIANTEGVIHPSQLIDAGDWFIEATSAIHHYGDSMIEYPSGCILALRDVYDIQKIVWGKNYVVETSEYRITKKLQRGTNENCIKAYSTNEETYHDGSLIHEPLDIALADIRRLALVLGYVVKEQSSGVIYPIQNR